MVNFQLLLSHFNIKGTFKSVKPLGNGHINDTYLVEMQDDAIDMYVLQRINNLIFKKPETLQENVLSVTNHLRNRIQKIKPNDFKYRSLELVMAHNGFPFYKDVSGNYWRVFIFIKNSQSFDRVSSAQQAFEGGKAFGEFQMLLADFDASKLHSTIPRFHDMYYRFELFDNQLESGITERITKSETLIKLVLEQRGAMCRFFDMIKNGDVPIRVTHNDTKFNNVLLDRKGKSLCVIDLDTVMPGSLLFDFGDAIRTVANTAFEDEQDPGKVDFDILLYETYRQGYLSELQDVITPVEKKNLPESVLYMTFIIGLRFLTDYIGGDTYYKTKYPEHNYIRARNQFILFEKAKYFLNKSN